MGVPGIHIEQIFGSFGEKPGGPFFFVLIPWASENIRCGGGDG